MEQGTIVSTTRAVGAECGKNWNRPDEKAPAGFLQDRHADVRFTATTERTRRSYRPAKKIEPEQGR